MFNSKDTYRYLFPKGEIFSRYYTKNNTLEGGTKLDCIYSNKNLIPISVLYIPNAFSDHYCYVTTINFDETIPESLAPKPRPIFKIKPITVDDDKFQNSVKLHLVEWITQRKNLCII